MAIIVEAMAMEAGEEEAIMEVTKVAEALDEVEDISTIITTEEVVTIVEEETIMTMMREEEVVMANMVLLLRGHLLASSLALLL